MSGPSDLHARFAAVRELDAGCFERSNNLGCGMPLRQLPQSPSG
jgi:hypothetical protein